MSEQAVKTGISKIWKADEEYLERMRGYSLRDTLCAAGYYVLILAVYYAMGSIYASSGKYYGIPVNLALMLIPVVLCRKFSQVGLSGRNLKVSLIVSGAIGVVFLLSFTIIPGIVTHAPLLPAGKILYNILYFFIVIGLSEEVGFRGFIQPRLYPLVKKEWLTVLTGGVLFVFMHYPFQMAVRGMSFTEYLPLFLESAPYQFLWHLAFTALYRRFGNIFGNTVLHGFVDMSMGIFG